MRLVDANTEHKGSQTLHVEMAAITPVPIVPGSFSSFLHGARWPR